MRRFVLAAVAVLSLASAVSYYRDAGPSAAQDITQTYVIGVEEARLREIMTMIPPESVVGYFTEVPVRRDAHWPTNNEFLFTAVRYALAPRLLVPYEDAKNPDWVLGVFPKPVNLAQTEKARGLRLVKDYGSGVVLFRRK